MSRTQETNNAAAVDDAFVNRLILARLDFASGVVAVHSGIGSFDYNGDTYTGVGQLGAISAISEDRERTTNPVRLQLSGVDASLLSDALTADYHGRDADLYHLWLDADNQPLDDPDNFWSGFMDSMTVTLAAGAGVITVTCESRSVLTGPRISRYTDEEQQRRFAGDTAFRFLDQMQDRQLTWGGRYVVAGGAGRAPGRGVDSDSYTRAIP